MKSRIISALIGLPILIVVLFFHHTIVFNIAMAAISMIAVYEMLYATKYVTNKAIIAISMLFGAAVPFSHIERYAPYFVFSLMIFVTLLLLILFVKHKTLPFQEVAIAFTSAFLLPYALSSIVFVREIEPSIAIYFIMMILICAWITDIGAYFTGMIFGKHKLAPTISPKKTVEGAVGGVIFCLIFNIAFTYVYAELVAVQINLLPLVVITLIASLVGMVGDLSMSIIKRQCGIKDFGHLMPGHGGVLDRFDSIMFIAPFLYIVLQIFSLTQLVK